MSGSVRDIQVARAGDGHMNKSTILVCALTMLFASLVVGQVRPDQPSGLIVNIRPDFESLDGEGPLVMSVHLNNGSQKKFRTERLPIVILEKIGDDATDPEWAIQAFVRLDPKSPYAKNDYLNPGEAATLSVDLHGLEWNNSISSILGNSKLALSLSPGRYRLRVRMDRTFRDENGEKKIEPTFSNEFYLRYK